MSVELSGERIVVFRSARGELHAVAARCPHLGSDLGRGRIVGDAIECPYHRLRFRGDGSCPQANALEARVYPTAERFGAVFVYTGATPAFEFPEFDQEPDLVSARPLRFRVATPWYMIGANAFDARHFRAAHNRRLIRKPSASFADPVAARVAYEYAIEGRGLFDRVIRTVSGPKVAFEVTSWRGNVLLVSARFQRDASFGVVVATPDDTTTAQTMVTVIVNARPGRASAVLDRLRAELKRTAIRQMLLDDFESLQALDYVHDGLLRGDEVLAAYLRWVRDAAQNLD
jgi:phenylpropionate dioxygenase-like ring-hydroxylating dioxygenase large terminal subunit